MSVRRLPARWFWLSLLVCVGLIGVLPTPVRAQFTAQIQTALITLGIWPYDGSYANNEVPTWSTAAGKFVAASGGGGLQTDINLMEVGGSNYALGQGTMAASMSVAIASNQSAVPITDGAGALNVICDSGCSGGTQYTQDTALTVATSVGTMAMGRASAAVPTDVSNDNDAVMPWYLRSGALSIQPTFGGVLGLAGNGAAGTAAQRVTIANDSTGVLATVGAVTSITNPVTVTDGAGALNTIVDSGTLTAVTSITNTVNTIGTLANDAGAAGTNRVPTLPVITENAAPSRTDGRNAALSGTLGGAIRVMLSNAAGAALSLASDLVFGTATYTEATTTGPLVGAVRTDTPAALANTTNEVAPLSSSALGGLYTASASDPCSRLAKTVIPISIVTATTTELTAALAGASNFYYVCSINLGPTAGAQNLALTDDDSDGCGSVTSGMAGGTTAGTGWNFGANGGVAYGNGLGTIAKTNGTNRVICAVTSAAVQISGVMTVVAAP